ncbi:kinase-like domain-containing protein, partial [Baffinella frigidus]
MDHHEAAGHVPVPHAEAGWLQVEGEPLHNSEACEVKIAMLQMPGDVATRRVVLKRCKISCHDALARFRREAALMRRLSHPCLASLICIVELPPTYGLVSELATRGSLAQVMYGSGEACVCFQWQGVALIAHDVSCALAFLHQETTLHRDIKPANVLLMDDGRILLIDLDHSEAEGARVQENKKRGPSGGNFKNFLVGTLLYMAPEVLLKQGSMRASDIYSLAISLCELASGVVPYSDARTSTEQMHTVLEAKYNLMSLTTAITSDHLRPALPSDGELPSPLVDVITRGWAPSSAHRPSAAAVCAEAAALLVSGGVDMGDAQARAEALTPRASPAQQLPPAAAAPDAHGLSPEAYSAVQRFPFLRLAAEQKGPAINSLKPST